MGAPPEQRGPWSRTSSGPLPPWPPRRRHRRPPRARQGAGTRAPGGAYRRRWMSMLALPPRRQRRMVMGRAWSSRDSRRTSCPITAVLSRL
uniref:Uncharacterized protein n=1 Tax=Arundo donax TaxID=35708 RepID=A0A0A9D2V9_ARUDO